MGEPDRAIRVLIVDDHAVVRRGLLAFLATEPDLDVVGDAAGGEEALGRLELLDAAGRRPDVVLMDLQMKPVDGIETTRRLRERYDDVEIVALTSFAEEARVHAALAAGASGYVLKDADADEVVAAIRAAHRGGLQLDPAVARRLLASRARPRPRSRRASSTCCGSSARAGPTRRSPPPWSSVSGPSGPTCRTSSASSASARAPRPRCGPRARASWTSGAPAPHPAQADPRGEFMAAARSGSR
jgi:DNA-binding NarL/FixJ family response regulator